MSLLLLCIACQRDGPDPSTPTSPPPDTSTTSRPTGDTATSTPDPTATTAATASTADTGPQPPWETDPRYVLVDGATALRGGNGEYFFGTALASGADLDKDGILEWTATAPSKTPLAVVRSFEGTDVVTERRPTDISFANAFGVAAAHADLDSDGYLDLVFALHAGGVGRLQTLTSTDEASDAFYKLDADNWEDPFSPWANSLHADGTKLTIGWTGNVGRHVTHGPLPTGATSTSDEPLLLDPAVVEVLFEGSDEEGIGGSTAVYEPVVVTDGAATSLWMGAVYTLDGDSTGELWSCPDERGLDLQTHCTLMAEARSIGVRQCAFDLDGDGSTEVASSGPWGRDDEGVLRIYAADGTLRATLEHTDTAFFSKLVHAALDADGNAWLLVGKQHQSSPDYATVYAFRGTDLVGDLTELDAERVYVSQIGTSFQAIETYRETPDAPPQLLLSNLYDGNGAVYMLPFTPGEDPTTSPP